jgi:putative transposase
MPRRPRRGTGGLVFHVMNRGARRLALFECPGDYAAFVRVLQEATARLPMRLLCWVVMPNHWHLVLWPSHDHELSLFMAWLTVTHSRRWHLSHSASGTGTIYQGRYKAIPVKDDRHFLTVCRYVERNPVRARLVRRVEEWPWSSASGSPNALRPATHEWPIPRPPSWDEQWNAAESGAELERVRESIRRGRPFGPEGWRDQTARDLGWRMGMRPPGPLPRASLMAKTEI